MGGMKDLIFLINLVLIVLVPVISSDSPVRFRPTWRQSKEVEFDVDKSSTKPEAILLFDKKFRNKVFAIGWKVEVEYRLINIGDEAASEIQVFDPDFSSGDPKFVVLNGEADFKIAGLKAGEDLTFNLTAIPTVQLPLGQFSFRSARVIYRPSTSSDEEMTGWSSLSPFHNGNVEMLSKPEADRRYSTRKAEFFVLLLLSLPSIVVPFSMWKSHTSKYNKLQEDVNLLKKNRKGKKSVI